MLIKRVKKCTFILMDCNSQALKHLLLSPVSPHASWQELVIIFQWTKPNLHWRIFFFGTFIQSELRHFHFRQLWTLFNVMSIALILALLVVMNLFYVHPKLQKFGKTF